MISLVVGRMALSEAECYADSSQGMREVPVCWCQGYMLIETNGYVWV